MKKIALLLMTGCFIFLSFALNGRASTNSPNPPQKNYELSSKTSMPDPFYCGLLAAAWYATSIQMGLSHEDETYIANLAYNSCMGEPQ